MAVETTLDVAAVLGEDFGLGREFEALFGRVDVLLKTLDWRDPSGLTDEGGDLFNVGLDRGKDLNTGGARR